ncbi:MAG: isoprenylcysteine carboxyl methyltransferase [Gemmatimonadetes bacterium]|nr:MAG: isoprenylcysteine carboxyl methyltransferase [Gemmatimonadota bacterium]
MICPAVRTAVFAIVAPGTVLGYVPYLLLSGRGGAGSLELGPWRWAGLLPLALGGAGIVWCFRDFAVVGRGTPAPIDPPRQLVATGLFRWVRNPIYVALVLALVGEAIVFQATVLLLYSAAVFVACHLFVVLYEEPALRRRFGESYERYRRTVARWLPRRPR